MIATQIIIERDGAELEVRVTFEHHRAHKGQRDSIAGVANAGPLIEPDEPEELEFINAELPNGVPVELTDDEIYSAMENAMQQLSERNED